MAGYVWIVLGIIACAFGTYALGYGWHILSKTQSQSSTHIAGDYVVGEKTVVNQTVQVGGDFIQIGNPIDSDLTGNSVNLVLSVAAFVAENESVAGNLSVEKYAEWLRGRREQDAHFEHTDLLAILEGDAGQAGIVRACIERVMAAVQGQREDLDRIIKHTRLLPGVDSKLDYLIGELSRSQSSGLHQGQLAVSARVLSTLSEGVTGAGAKLITGKSIDPRAGTAMVVWLLGTQSPHMMLLDVVGDLRKNRLSMILNEDASIGIRAFDGAGRRIELTSGGYPAMLRLVIIATWQDCALSLWVNGTLQGSTVLSKSFDYLGPVCLAGMDIDGELSADAVRWTGEGEEVGLNFMKDGIWHGSRYDTVTLWERVLEEPEVKTLAADPWVMFRQKE